MQAIAYAHLFLAGRRVIFALFLLQLLSLPFPFASQTPHQERDKQTTAAPTLSTKGFCLPNQLTDSLA